MTRDRHSTPTRIFLLAAGLAAARLLIHLLVHAAYGGFTFLLSPTEIERTRAAMAFAAHPAFAPLGILYWLPLQFWIEGTVLRFWADPLAVPFAVNAAASALTVSGVVLWTWELAGEGAAWAAGAAVLVSATGIVQGAGGSADPLLHAALVWGLLFWARYEKSGRASQAWLCALCLALGCAARYECWIVLAGLSAAAIRDRKRASILPLAAVWLVPAIWAAYNMTAAGSPWAFYSRTVAAEIRDMSQPRWRMSMEFFSDFLNVVPPWLLALLLGSAAADEPRLPRSYWLSLGAIALLFIGMHPIGMFQVDDHTWTVYLLALPAAGAAVAKWLSGAIAPSRRVRAAAAACALLLTAESVQFFMYANYFQRVAPVSSIYMRLRDLRREGALSGADAILVEIPQGPRRNVNQYQLWRLEPGMRGLYDRRMATIRGQLETKDNDSELDRPRMELGAWLKERGVRVVVAFQHDAALSALGWKRAGGPPAAGVWLASGDALAGGVFP